MGDPRNAPVPDSSRASDSSRRFAAELEAARHGDPHALGIVADAAWTDVRARARRFANRCPGLLTDPSNLAADVVARVVAKFHTFRGTRRPSYLVWVRVIYARRLGRYFRRKRLPTVGLDQHEPADPRPSPGIRFEAKEAARRLVERVDELSPKLRSVVKLHHTDRLSFADIDRRLGCAPGTCGKRHERALKQLRRLLDPEEHGN